MTTPDENPNFIVLCHENGRPVWHVASMRKRKPTEAEKKAAEPIRYGTHTLPREFWTAPRDAQKHVAFQLSRSRRAASKHGVREAYRPSKVR